MKYEVIDAHVHPFLPSCGKNIGRFGLPATTEEFFENLRALGISQCCGSFIDFAEKMDFKTLMTYNNAALELREKYPCFYVPGIHVHGEYPEESRRMLRDFYSAGVRWIGEMVNYCMPTGPYDSCGMMKIWETAEELGMVANLHVNDPDLPGLENIVKTFPRLNVVLAHPGDGGAYPKRIALVKKYSNLHLDISGTGLFRWGMLRNAVDELGAEKVLFGSDFPVCSAGMNLHGALSEPLSEEEFKLVLAGNFRRLTGI